MPISVYRWLTWIVLWPPVELFSSLPVLSSFFPPLQEPWHVSSAQGPGTNILPVYYLQHKIKKKQRHNKIYCDNRLYGQLKWPHSLLTSASGQFVWRGCVPCPCCSSWSLSLLPSYTSSSPSPVAGTSFWEHHQGANQHHANNLFYIQTSLVPGHMGGEKAACEQGYIQTCQNQGAVTYIGSWPFDCTVFLLLSVDYMHICPLTKYYMEECIPILLLA